MELNATTQILITIVGSGALFSFIQFLIQRKDKKAENETQKQIETLEKEFENSIKEKEDISKMRFEEHQKAISESNTHHAEDFKKLIEAINQLKENDTKITQSIENITNNQITIGEAIMGIAHDKLVHCTDKISDRGAITLKEQATLTSIYDPYKKMGGNSHARAGYEHVMKLPVVSEDEAKKMDKELKGKVFKEFNSCDI